MLAWPAPSVPRLPDPVPDSPSTPGARQPVCVHDTSSGTLLPAAAGHVARIYVCGITPYDATHLGHAATYVAFDLLVRALRDAGHEVRYVQNVTDVDDPLLERALATGRDWRELAQEQTALFGEDMTALAVLPPDEYLGAVETVPLVVAAVARLMDGGSGYLVGPDDDGRGDGDVYFEVAADPRFGEVSHLDRAQMLALFSERGGDPDRPGKRDPLDCLLWRRERPGEPAWDGGPLGRGRPGWHLECTAIALEHLGMPIDVQGGGSDLIFPHHEMGASEAHLLTGSAPYARAYVHAGMVGLDGEKMSKSRGNLVLVSKLRQQGVDPMAIRLALLSHHYRDDWEWTDDDLKVATERLATWRAALGRSGGADGEQVLAQVRAALAHDLNAPAALAAVDEWAVQRGEVPDERAPGLVSRTIDALLGVRL